MSRTGKGRDSPPRGCPESPKSVADAKWNCLKTCSGVPELSTLVASNQDQTGFHGDIFTLQACCKGQSQPISHGISAQPDDVGIGPAYQNLELLSAQTPAVSLHGGLRC